MNTQKEQDIKNRERIDYLLVQAKRSIDEERDVKTHFSEKVYHSDFIPDKESINTISSIMSAMVSQIATEHSPDHSQVEASTEAETIDDIFEKFENEILCDNNLKERQHEEESENISHHDQHIKGVLGQSINVYETFDTSTKPL